MQRYNNVFKQPKIFEENVTACLSPCYSNALWLGISPMIGIEQAFFYFPTWIKTGPF
jgi:hypothetical protein